MAKTNKKNKNELVFLPLGGCGEIGMNLNLYGYGPAHSRKWIMLDLGVTFGDQFTPGVDIIMPETEFIEEHKKDLLGIVLTHAHEDHMGALARLWERFKCPVYATPFTMYLVRDRLSEAGILDQVDLREIPLKGKFSLGDFDLELITLTHSIPEPNAVAIRTPAGTILHTGDWKIDHAPMIGEGVDEAALRALGDEGILAMVCDSTNVFSPGEAGSEGDVRREMIKLVGEFGGRKIAVASFASNVARLSSVMVAAAENQRSVCLVGRSMLRMYGAAKAVGILENLAEPIDEMQAANMPDGNILYLCTGSQGEPRAALSRIAEGTHRNVKLSKGDAVIFSSKIIPGNEKGIFALQNMLADNGIEVITEKARDIHVSGHPCRDELAQMYDWARPHISVPVHGERRHLLEHAKLAKTLGIKHTIAPHNGEMILLSEKGAKIIDLVPNGRLHEDGGQIVSAGDNGLRERKKMSFAGHIGVTIVTNNKGDLLAGPEPRISGWAEGRNGELIGALLDDVADIAEKVFRRMSKKTRVDEDKAEGEIATALRRKFRNMGFKRPLVDVTIMRIN